MVAFRFAGHDLLVGKPVSGARFQAPETMCGTTPDTTVYGPSPCGA